MYSTALTVSLWQKLEAGDKWLFEQLNGRWTSPVLDSVVPYLRNAIIWLPLYLFLLVFVLLNFGKKGIWWCLAFICTVAFTDSIGAQVFKEFFQRLRPCNDPDMAGHVRLLLSNCPGSYSFVSNHAANHFGIATFAFLTFRGLLKRWSLVTYLWAACIVYAQVYVGVHYPLDILGGAVLGVVAGVLTARVFHNKWGKLNLDNQLV